MTQTIANRMTTAPDPVFVACSPLQPQEEMLAGDRMAEVHGGAILPVLIVAARVAAPYVARVAIPALSAAAGAIIATNGLVVVPITSKLAKVKEIGYFRHTYKGGVQCRVPILNISLRSHQKNWQKPNKSSDNTMRLTLWLFGHGVDFVRSAQN